MFVIRAFVGTDAEAWIHGVKKKNNNTKSLLAPFLSADVKGGHKIKGGQK